MRPLLGVVLLLMFSPAQADWEWDFLTRGHWYTGLQVGYTETKIDAGTAHPVTLHALGGYQFNPYLGIETRIGLGLNDDTVVDDVEAGIDSYYGLYLTGTWPLTDWVKLYGLLGATNLDLEANDQPSQRSDSATDLSYGVGFSLYATEQLSLNLEVISWVEKGRFDVSALNFGVRYDF
ncbi:porin family protein [Ferrimonas marina]|uniref:Opacity protein n=1 Tax=Ferrimonas marina TaxID=299255 RepID=A0A1M5XQH1_9GAMM|nr:porin family protein [Ferrimonas marina]SHI02095.1 Opacity protein [Ferrimonas marina]